MPNLNKNLLSNILNPMGKNNSEICKLEVALKITGGCLVHRLRFLQPYQFLAHVLTLLQVQLPASVQLGHQQALAQTPGRLPQKPCITFPAPSSRCPSLSYCRHSGSTTDCLSAFRIYDNKRIIK